MYQAHLESRMFYFDDLFDSGATDDDIFAAVQEPRGRRTPGKVLGSL